MAAMLATMVGAAVLYFCERVSKSLTFRVDDVTSVYMGRGSTT